MVEEAQLDVNRKIPAHQQVTPNFRLLIACVDRRSNVWLSGTLQVVATRAGGRSARATMRGLPMLRAALIGFASSGKTTLFQLMTTVRETARPAHGKGEALIGISKVPDARLDRLTAMYNPKKRVPATVEFSDLAAPGGTGGAQALVDVAAYKNADALVHVVRAFQDPAVPHPSGSIDPARDAQGMEDELILADLGVAVPRRARRGTSAPLPRSAGRRPQAVARLSVSLRQTAPDRREPRRGAALG